MQEMIKVLIVDDELMVRVGLSATIKWEEYGFQVIGSCENGKQAVREIDKSLPDIVFTDLKMPVMDGFELIRYIRKNHPGIKIIALSCLDEVDSVKTAMKLGADDYILKLSLSADGLKKLLAQMKESIVQDKNKVRCSMEKQAEDPGKKLQIYRRLLKYEILPEKAEPLLQKYSPGSTGCDRFVACCCAVDNPDTLEASDGDVMQYAIDNILKEFFQDLAFSELLQVEKNERAVFLGSSLREAGKLKNLPQSLRKINAVMKTHINVTLSYGITEPFDNLKHLPEQYRMAKERLTDRFFSGKESVLLCSRDQSGKKKLSAVPLAFSLQSMIESQNRQGAEAVIDKWFSRIRSESRLYSARSVKAAVAGAWSFVSGYGVLDEEEPGDFTMDETEYFSSFLNTESCEELRRIFCRAIASLIDIVSESQSVHPEIMALKKYLTEHVEEEISLTEAANRCCLNKTYFCSLFKKEVGETYNEYCERLKMERARQLLALDHLKMYEVGVKVGISNESYFNRRFKKYFGVTPGQMRQGKCVKNKIL